MPAELSLTDIDIFLMKQKSPETGRVFRAFRDIGKAIGKTSHGVSSGKQTVAGGELPPENDAGRLLRFHVDRDEDGWLIGHFFLRTLNEDDLNDKTAAARKAGHTTEWLLERFTKAVGKGPIYMERSCRVMWRSARLNTMPLDAPRLVLLEGQPLEFAGIEYASADPRGPGVQSIRMKKKRDGGVELWLKYTMYEPWRADPWTSERERLATYLRSLGPIVM